MVPDPEDQDQDQVGLDQDPDLVQGRAVQEVQAADPVRAPAIPFPVMVKALVHPGKLNHRSFCTPIRCLGVALLLLIFNRTALSHCSKAPRPAMSIR